MVEGVVRLCVAGKDHGHTIADTRGVSFHARPAYEED
jgi:hypothetical protein